MSFGPNHTPIQDILINSLGALIAGITGSIIIVVITFMASNVVDVPGTFTSAQAWLAANSGIFPILLSIITLIGTSITMFMTYFLLHMTAPQRYKKNLTILGQIAFFVIFCYVCVTPAYVYLGLVSYENILYVFLGHTLFLTFGTSVLLEILNNYRYILTGLYGSFVGLLVSIFLTIIIFSSFSAGFAKLISLIVLLPVINFCVTFFKQLFELAYYHYNRFTNLDPLGDIFYQIELEEKEALEEEEEKNSI